MAFSVGILYSVQSFLKLISRTTINETEFLSAFVDRYELTTSQKVLKVAEDYNWIKLDIYGCLAVSEKGNEIISQDDMLNGLRVQLSHLIEKVKPTWSYLIHKGRKEAYQYFPAEVKQCFRDADLINSYNLDVIKWWDRLALIARGIQQNTQLEIGRIGEELSFKYEKNRTGKYPEWQSIESNLSGYDILSNISSTDTTPLNIEVKTTNNNSRVFTFYLSRNEWNIAESSQNYIFHLWLMNKEPELFIVDKTEIACHIPSNQGNGSWENVKIVFKLEYLRNIKRRND